MRTVAIDVENLNVRNVWFNAEKVYLDFQDGRTMGAPLAWFPRLQNATDAQRQNWRLIGRGYGVHWEDLDEDLSAEGMFLFTKENV
ncbi:MAG: DUF2442 domain-containing protein [Cytophagaceae bacterium]|nr:DUF2442 domain-containing protein [Cytophagaceae bacterium]